MLESNNLKNYEEGQDPFEGRERVYYSTTNKAQYAINPLIKEGEGAEFLIWLPA